MIFYFLDTSALAKLYVKEAGSRKLHAWVRSAREDAPAMRVWVSRLGYPEAMSAITRRRNQRSLTDNLARQIRHRLVHDFTAPVSQYGIVEPSEVVVNRAALLVAQHHLRAFDAVQLSAALYLQMILRAHTGQPLVFVSSDVRLSEAARAEQLTTLDPVV